MAKIRSSEITDKRVYLNRRAFIAAALAASGCGLIEDPRLSAQEAAAHGRKWTTVKSPLSTNEAQTPYNDVTHYNNFYEFGTDKTDPAAAIYHFQAYLKLRPEAQNQDVVKQRITTCKQELAKNVVLAPLTDRQQREFEQLLKENKRLDVDLKGLKT